MVPENEINNILEPNYDRRKIKNSPNKGASLGITLVLEFLELIDGKIAIESNKNEFTKLTKEEILLKVTKGKAFTCPCCGSTKFKFIGIIKHYSLNNTS